MAPYHRRHGLFISFYFISFIFSLGWVRALFGVTDYIISTLLSNYIIAMHHYFVYDLYRLDCAASHSLSILFQCSGAISPSQWVIFSSYLFPPLIWVQPLNEINYYIRSTLLSNYIIAIYHYFIRDPYELVIAVSHSLAILFQRNCAVSPSPWFYLVLFYHQGWVQPLVGITDYIRSTLLSDHIIDICHYFIQDHYRLDCAMSYYLSILFQRNCAVSLLKLFNIVF